MDNKKIKISALSKVTRVFIENNLFLKRFLTRYLRSEQDIEDVIQEVYLKAVNAEQKKDIEHPKAFLFTIARNLALNELNRKSRQMTNYIEDCLGSLPQETGESIENEYQAKQTLGIHCEAIAALPEKCRRVYLLRKVHGLAHKEIAERLGISLSGVEKHLRLGIASCRGYMKNHNGDDVNSKRVISNGSVIFKVRS